MHLSIQRLESDRIQDFMSPNRFYGSFELTSLFHNNKLRILLILNIFCGLFKLDSVKIVHNELRYIIRFSNFLKMKHFQTCLPEPKTKSKTKNLEFLNCLTNCLSWLFFLQMLSDLFTRFLKNFDSQFRNRLLDPVSKFENVPFSVGFHNFTSKLYRFRDLCTYCYIFF